MKMFKDLSKDKKLRYCGCSSDGAGGDASCSSGDDGGGDDGAAQAQAQAEAESFSRSTAAEEAIGMETGFSFSGPDSSLSDGFGGYDSSSQYTPAPTPAPTPVDTRAFPGIENLARTKNISVEEAKDLVNQDIAQREVSKNNLAAPFVDLSQPVGINISQRAIDSVSDLMAVGKDEEAQDLSQTYADSYTGIKGVANRAIDYVAENPFATLAAPFTLGMSIPAAALTSAAARAADSYGVRGETAEEALSEATYGLTETGARNAGMGFGAQVGYGFAGPTGAAVGAIAGGYAGSKTGTGMADSFTGNQTTSTGSGSGDGYSYGDGYSTDRQPAQQFAQPVQEEQYIPYQSYVPSYDSLQNVNITPYKQHVSWQDGVPHYQDTQGNWVKFIGY
jgi:hypothetical protein